MYASRKLIRIMRPGMIEGLVDMVVSQINRKGDLKTVTKRLNKTVEIELAKQLQEFGE